VHFGAGRQVFTKLWGEPSGVNLLRKIALAISECRICLEGDEFMRSKNARIFISLILSILLIVGWTVYGQRSTPQRPVWEYKIANNLSDQQLNELGSQGWEMVTATVGGGNYTFYFKRAKQP
jgi:hypothetical protein